ncbi:sensor histidine kinase [Cohnella sp. GCM10020058]|uniref:sensor histidine kinase n=1 Tax=Cohnella sp. GCM10020058 TaxID=3317330 RepID=UPI00362A0A20
MNVKWRLSLRLIGWLACFGVLLLTLAGIVFVWIVKDLASMQEQQDFRSIGLSRLVDTVRAEGDNWRFDPELIGMIERTGGWLQRIDENGKVTDAFFTPPDVPQAYNPGELTAYWTGELPFPYRLSIWVGEKNGVTHTLLYGMSTKDEEFLASLIAAGPVREGKFALPAELMQQLELRGAWLQLLNADGEEVAAANKPPNGAIDRISATEMVLRASYPERYGSKIVTKYDPLTQRTWMLSIALPGYEPGEKPVLVPAAFLLAKGIGVLVAGAMLLLLLLSYLFGHRMGAPVVHVLNWLRLLDKGQYVEPTDTHGIPKSKQRHGKTKGKYKVYGDVIHSLESLSGTLHRNERLQIETEQVRDEWIAGVSHDLKTPLSSIKGYAHMLETEDYEWSTDEVRAFARVILDKSSHMDALINDLTLTYLLRSGQKPPSQEMVEMNAFLEEILREAAQNPVYSQGVIRFVPGKPVYLSIYKPWLQRIVDNLVANALLHNGVGTTLTITLEASKADGTTITFSDDGEGMDEQTQRRLFERYYRGTDSESRTEGTGLGMAVSKGLAEALGATIELDTRAEGTSIRMTWRE